MNQRKVEIAPHVHFAQVEQSYVLMDLKRGIYLGLDAVASHIWQSLSEHGDMIRAAEDLCRDYEVDREQAVADIESWVAELAGKGLVVLR
ncbi:MAG TPA: PqqD family protein [Thermoanaerobaculia bacterium]|nr:PqqD family protein [Thermoanaerobaculia bacterium]